MPPKSTNYKQESRHVDYYLLGASTAIAAGLIIWGFLSENLKDYSFAASTVTIMLGPLAIFGYTVTNREIRAERRRLERLVAEQVHTGVLQAYDQYLDSLKRFSALDSDLLNRDYGEELSAVQREFSLLAGRLSATREDIDSWDELEITIKSIREAIKVAARKFGLDANNQMYAAGTYSTVRSELNNTLERLEDAISPIKDARAALANLRK